MGFNLDVIGVIFNNLLLKIKKGLLSRFGAKTWLIEYIHGNVFNNSRQVIVPNSPLLAGGAQASAATPTTV